MSSDEVVYKGRRHYDNCNITHAEMVTVDHRLKTLEEDFEEIKASNKLQEKMIVDIHQKIMNSNNLILGIKMGVGSVIATIILLFYILSDILSGQGSIKDILKIFN